MVQRLWGGFMGEVGLSWRGFGWAEDKKPAGLGRMGLWSAATLGTRTLAGRAASNHGPPPAPRCHRSMTRGPLSARLRILCSSQTRGTFLKPPDQQCPHPLGIC